MVSIFAALAVVALLMLVEAGVSRRNERALRAVGAREPPGDPYRIMQVAYPAGFLAMAIEGLARGAAHGLALAIGATVFTVAKALKYWAIATLGDRWSFRVLVVPGLPLVTRGPYRRLRHPNYLAVAGEIVGAAMMMSAPVAGLATLVGFSLLMRRRIVIEERALGLRASPAMIKESGRAHVNVRPPQG